MSLIGAEQTFALGAVVLLLTTFGFWAERHAWGQRLGGPLVMLGAAMLVANLGLIPHESPVYDNIAGLLVPMAIPLLLLRADMAVIWRESGPMLLIFLCAAVATAISAWSAAQLVPLGPLGPEIAGTITASYIGGSLNFVATAEAVGLRDSALYVAALSADAAGGVLFLMLLMLLPVIPAMRRWLPSRYLDAASAVTEADASATVLAFNLPGASLALAISLSLCAFSQWISAAMGQPSLFIVLLTVTSLALANFAKPLVSACRDEFALGTLLMYVFFVVIGAGAQFNAVATSALPMLVFVALVVTVHLLLMVSLGRLLRWDLAELMIASNACILGPPAAAALAAGRGWRELVAPGILVGILGYAIATFVGVGLTTLLR